MVTMVTINNVPCARYFSYEVTICERGSRDMRIRPFSYPHPFPTSFPALGCSFGTRPHYRAGFRPGNIPWKFGLAFFSKFCFCPGRSVLSPWSTWRGRRIGFFKGGGGVGFWFFLALYFFALHYMILHYLVLYYIISRYYSLL
jgi:hypothetical protein